MGHRARSRSASPTSRGSIGWCCTSSSGRVWMAHPFSGLPTPYTAEIGERSWFANCAWDALAILALLGDGVARGEDSLVWTVVGGVVSPDGLVHLLVPARRFWDDIGFT